MKLKKYFLGISVIFLVFQKGFLSLGLKTLGSARRQRYRHSPGYLLLVTLLKLQGGMSVAHTAGHLLLTLLLTEAGKTLGSECPGSGALVGEGGHEKMGREGAPPWWVPVHLLLGQGVV